MLGSVAEWDERDRPAAGKVTPEPAGLVTGWLPFVPRGPVLDLACGAGRHALLLASRGRHVTAVDGSGTALDILEQRARAAHLLVRHISKIGGAEESRAGIDLALADLEHAGLPQECFAVIL